jgi:hypothetical protein
VTAAARAAPPEGRRYERIIRTRRRDDKRGCSAATPTTSGKPSRCLLSWRCSGTACWLAAHLLDAGIVTVTDCEPVAVGCKGLFEDSGFFARAVHSDTDMLAMRWAVLCFVA